MAINQRFIRNKIQTDLDENEEVTREITPSPNFLNVLEHSGYTDSQAILDIIDNSIDADSTKITLQIGHKKKEPFVIIRGLHSGHFFIIPSAKGFNAFQ